MIWTLHTTKARLGKQKWQPTCWVHPGGLQSRVTWAKIEQQLLPHPFHPPTGSHPGGICWLPFYHSTCSHISEPRNHTICPSAEVNLNSFSLDWASALNSSTVLGDLSDSWSPRTSSDWFFREWIAWGRRWSMVDRKNALKWVFLQTRTFTCMHACTYTVLFLIS